MQAQVQQLPHGRQPGHALDGHVEGVLDECFCACTEAVLDVASCHDAEKLLTIRR